MRSKHTEGQKEHSSYLDNAKKNMCSVSLKTPFSINEQTDNVYTLTKDDRNEIGLLSFPGCEDVLGGNVNTRLIFIMFSQTLL